jgi:hypothetical protein
MPLGALFSWMRRQLPAKPRDPHQRRVRDRDVVGHGKRCPDKAKKAARKRAEASRRRNRV